MVVCVSVCVGVGGGGGGADRSVDVASLSITHHSMHLIMGAVSLWTRPPALYLCTGPKKIPTSACQHSNCSSSCTDGTTHLPSTTTGTSTTLSKNCKKLRIFCTVSDHELCRCTNRHVRTLSKNCQRKRIFCTVWTMSACGTCCNCTTGTSTTICTATGKSLWFSEQSGP